MIKREHYLKQINQQFQAHRIVALIGPRQCGKTTLAKQIQEQESDFPRANYFDLERAADMERLKNVELALSPLNGLVIIDEVQRLPDLFTNLRYIHDHDETKRFLILGSASRELLRQTSESLAGRIGYIEISPFNGLEVKDIQALWIKGGYPKSYLAESNEISLTWRKNYIRTYLEQDIPALGFAIPAENIRRFWMMLTNYHGQLFNSSELGKSLGISHTTARSYLDLLANTFMVRQLQPWYENISKRQVKTPKIYIRDSGILHALLNVTNIHDLLISPKLGASWEGFALEQVVSALGVDNHDCYFWSTHNQSELDLLVFYKGLRWGVEFKYQDAPKLTPSLKLVTEDLKLNKVTVIYPGDVQYTLMQNIEVIGLNAFLKEI